MAGLLLPLRVIRKLLYGISIIKPVISVLMTHYFITMTRSGLANSITLETTFLQPLQIVPYK